MRLSPEEKRSIFKKLIVVFFSVAIYFLFLRFDKLVSYIGYFLNISRPIVLGLSLGFILNILLVELEKIMVGRLKMKNSGLVRGISIVLTYILFFAFVVFMVASVVPKFIESIISLFEQLPSMIDTILSWLKRFELIEDQIPAIEEFIADINVVKVRDMAILFLFGDLGNAFTGTLNIVTTIVQSFFEIAMVIIFSIYALAGKENLQSNSRKLLYAIFNENAADNINKVGKLLYANFYHFFTGQLLEAFILGALCFVGMIILNMPFALMISVFVGFTNLIPYFGSALGVIVSSILIFITNPVQGIIFLIFSTILQQFDGNFLYPRLVGTKMGVPSIWILISITIGGALMGIIGMIIFVPLMSTVYILLKGYANNKVIRKNIDVEEKKNMEFVILDEEQIREVEYVNDKDIEVGNEGLANKESSNKVENESDNME